MDASYDTQRSERYILLRWAWARRYGSPLHRVLSADMRGDACYKALLCLSRNVRDVQPTSAGASVRLSEANRRGAQHGSGGAAQPRLDVRRFRVHELPASTAQKIMRDDQKVVHGELVQGRWVSLALPQRVARARRSGRRWGKGSILHFCKSGMINLRGNTLRKRWKTRLTDFKHVKEVNQRTLRNGIIGSVATATHVHCDGVNRTELHSVEASAACEAATTTDHPLVAVHNKTAMSTAHRPTWDPAQAKDVKGGSRQFSVRDMAAHTKLKFRCVSFNRPLRSYKLNIPTDNQDKLQQMKSRSETCELSCLRPKRRRGTRSARRRASHHLLLRTA